MAHNTRGINNVIPPSLMAEQAENYPLANRAPKSHDPSSAPAPIAKVRLADTIKRGERIYRVVVESVRDHATFMLDPNGYGASWNKGAEAIKGYSADEIIGQHCSIFYRPEDARSAGTSRGL